MNGQVMNLKKEKKKNHGINILLKMTKNIKRKRSFF